MKGIAATWKRWVQNGVRWWVNLEQEGLPKFAPKPILEVLLSDVYTQVVPESTLYKFLLHPSLTAKVVPALPLATDGEVTFKGTSVERLTCPPFAIKSNPSSPLLHQAVSTKGLLQVRFMIEEERCDATELRAWDSCSALFLAAEKGDKSIVQYLLQHYKAQGALSSMINAPKATGATPLHVASFLGHQEVVEILLSEGAEVNTQLATNSNTPLYDAINQGQIAIAELLLSKGARPDILCVNGGVCMHAAAFSDSAMMIARITQIAPATLQARVGLVPLYTMPT